MGIRRKPSKKNGKTKIPSTAYPVPGIISAIADIDEHDKTANEACEALMNANPEVLEKYGVSISDYHGKPGQIAGGLRLRLDKLVEKDATIWDLAKAAGLDVVNPRPGEPKQKE